MDLNKKEMAKYQNKNSYSEKRVVLFFVVITIFTLIAFIAKNMN